MVAYHELQRSYGGPKQVLIGCASIISGIIWKKKDFFCSFCKSSTAGIISIFLKFLERNITRVMTCLSRKNDCFQVLYIW